MQKLTGEIKYKVFAEGTKSECQRPFVFLENGTQILLYKIDDNPFENDFFRSFENQKVLISGEFNDGVFEVDEAKVINQSADEGDEQ